MRTDLDHLPASKRAELERVVRILFDGFEESIRFATLPWKKRARILKVILYGSYARGDWVDDPVGGYISDYDLLVVVNDDRLTDSVDYWSKADDQLLREVTITKTISAPVNFIVHDLNDVNQQLSHGRPFFTDIAEQGIALYEAEGFPLTTPRVLPPDEARVEALKYFDKWIPSAVAFQGMARHAIVEGNNNEAAFVLHQAVERLYHGMLLVLKLYSPKSHRLAFLRSHCEEVAPALIEAWPRENKADRRRFELLRRAYLDARYSPHYKITYEELAWLSERVEVLQALVTAVCEQRLAVQS